MGSKPLSCPLVVLLCARSALLGAREEVEGGRTPTTWGGRSELLYMDSGSLTKLLVLVTRLPATNAVSTRRVCVRSKALYAHVRARHQQRS